MLWREDEKARTCRFHPRLLRFQPSGTTLHPAHSFPAPSSPSSSRRQFGLTTCSSFLFAAISPPGGDDPAPSRQQKWANSVTAGFYGGRVVRSRCLLFGTGGELSTTTTEERGDDYWLSRTRIIHQEQISCVSLQTFSKQSCMCQGHEKA